MKKKDIAFEFVSMLLMMAFIMGTVVAILTIIQERKENYEKNKSFFRSYITAFHSSPVCTYNKGNKRKDGGNKQKMQIFYK